MKPLKPPRHSSQHPGAHVASRHRENVTIRSCNKKPSEAPSAGVDRVAAQRVQPLDERCVEAPPYCRTSAPTFSSLSLDGVKYNGVAVSKLSASSAP
ncbi:hypothetical protein VZT92_014124 [Zoarces viviparus]